MPVRKKPFLLVLAGAALVVIACLGLSWERIAVRYHVHRLSAGQETLQGILAREPARIEVDSLDTFLRTPRGLEEVVRALFDEARGMCGGEGLATARRVLLWLDEEGELRSDVICGSSGQHVIGSRRGEDPARSFRRRLRPFHSRLPRFERLELEDPRMTLSVLPFEEGAAAFFLGQGIHPDKTPGPGEGAGTMAFFLVRAGRQPAPR
jgi:hypothetical protein